MEAPFDTTDWRPGEEYDAALDRQVLAAFRSAPPAFLLVSASRPKRKAASL